MIRLCLRLLALTSLVLSSGAAAYGQTQLSVLTGGAFFGWDVAGGADADGDGLGDVVSGTPGPGTGAVQVLLSSGGPPVAFSPATSATNFGFSLDWIDPVLGGPGARVVVGAPADAGGGTGTPGRVWLLDGLTLAPIAIPLGDVGSASGDELGRSVASVQDLDRDGVPDFVAGATGGGANGGGYVRVFSGLSGTMLFDIDGANSGDAFGSVVADATDVDLDGRGDILVAYPAAGGTVEVRSGLDGTRIRQLSGTGFPVAVAAGLNADTDFWPDLLIGRPGDTNPAVAGTGHGSIEVLSGRDLSPIRGRFYGDAAGDGLGASVAAAGDLDLDGTVDFVTSTDAAAAGYARVFSAATGQILMTVTGSAAFASAVDGAGDTNGDGLPEIVVTDLGAGTAEVWSAIDPSLDFDAFPPSISVSAGGSQILWLDAGPAAAGASYLVVGSTSGTAPGFGADGCAGETVPVPANFDAYFGFTLNNPNTAVLGNTFGTFDGQGRAIARINVAAGSVGAGIIANHAYGVLGASGACIDSASVATRLDLTP